MAKKAIIFDLYDTLLKVHRKTDPYLYLISTSRDKYDTKNVLNTVITENYTTPELKEYLGLSLDVDYFHMLLNIEIESTQTLPGTYTALTRLSEKYRLFLLSNLAVPYKGPYYKLGLNRYFEKAFFSCDEGDRKPNASFYQKVLDYSKLNKEDLLMIGDNPISDYKGAKDFGIDAILKESNTTLDQLVKKIYENNSGVESSLL